MIAYYLLEYGALLSIAAIFYADIEHGLVSLLRLTAAVGLLRLCCGRYFIANFSKQIRGLKLLYQKIYQAYAAHLHLN